MGVPQVAIVGRPNVGKSSLFNWLAGRRIAIVDPTPGVTRDRLASLVQAGACYFEIVDTGGMGIQDAQDLTADVERQIQLAIDRAELVLFVVDVRAGPVPLDEDVAQRLRGIGKPVLLLANKCDYADLDVQAADFYKLGFGDVHCVSAQQNRGKKELLRLIEEHLPVSPEPPPGNDEATLKLAIVGRRNTGKSTFINCLADEPRTIVSEVPGTTRDSVDVRFQRDGKTIVAIDTAGVRYRGKLQDDLEFYGLARAERSIRRADVVLHFLDAVESVSLVDKQLAGYVLEQYKPVIFVVNKWDLMNKLPTGEFGDYLHKVFPSLDFVPIAFITAKTGRNVQTVVNLAQNIRKQSTARVSTGELNRVLRQALAKQAPPARHNRVPRIYFATQVAADPPTLVLFTNGPYLFDNPYRRYLENVFRDQLPFKDIPIKVYFRDRNKADASPAKKKAIKRANKSGGTGELWTDV